MGESRREQLPPPPTATAPVVDSTPLPQTTRHRPFCTARRQRPSGRRRGWPSCGCSATPMEEAGSLSAPRADVVSEAGEPAACDCGAAYVQTAGPKLLAGKVPA